MINDVKYWTTSYALLPSDLYINFPYKKNISFSDEWGRQELNALCARVFKYFFYLVIKDIIENKAVFKFPPGARAWLEMIPITGDAFARARQNGAFEDVDFLASDFTGYQLKLKFTNRYGKWYKRIYVSSKYRDKITEMTNAGETW